MAERSVSFHCIVCYETFDHDVHFPVVLPCSHTYICNVCAHRLDKCMECRKSLMMDVTAGGGGGVGGTPNRSGPQDDYYMHYQRQMQRGVRLPSYIQSRLEEEARQRARQEARQTTPEHTREKVRLPLPKNLVLLSLMESSAAPLANFTTPTSSAESASEDADDEDIRIIAGFRMINGDCGTYAVTCPEGLMVVPRKDFDKKDEIDELSAVLEKIAIPEPKTPVKGAKRNSVAMSKPSKLPSSSPKPVKSPKSTKHPRRSSIKILKEALPSPPKLRMSFRSSSHPPPPPDWNDNNRLLEKCEDSKYKMGMDLPFEELSTEWDNKCDKNAPATPPRSPKQLVTVNLDDSCFPFRVSQGELLQVVQIDSDGWAKLARGRGYVQTRPGQDSNKTEVLVKVGGPKDKACLTEGKIVSVTENWSTLKQNEARLNRLLDGLKKELAASLIVEDDLTFMPAPFATSKDGEIQEEEKKDEKAVSSPVNSPKTRQASVIISATSTAGLSPDGDPNESSPNQDEAERSLSQQKNKNQQPSFLSFLPALGKLSIPVCGSHDTEEVNIPGMSSRSRMTLQDMLPIHGIRLPSATATGRSGRRRSLSAPNSPERNPQILSAFPDSPGNRPRHSPRSPPHHPSGVLNAGHLGHVDFRTGLSGHKALLSSKSHKHSSSDSEFPRISSHAGLSRFKRGGRATSPVRVTPVRVTVGVQNANRRREKKRETTDVRATDATSNTPPQSPRPASCNSNNRKSPTPMAGSVAGSQSEPSPVGPCNPDESFTPRIGRDVIQRGSFESVEIMPSME